MEIPPDANKGRDLRVTDKTLAAQLQITEREIEYRKNLLGITAADTPLLAESRQFIVERLDKIVGTFYDQQLEVSEIALLIGDADTLNRLREAMRSYILELFDGYYDAEYVNKRLRIGKVHKRIGVSPKLYISAINLLESIIRKFLDEHGKDSPFAPRLDQIKDALRRLMMFDIQLVFDTYISSLVTEVETAKVELEVYAESLERVVADRTEELKELAIRDGLTGLLNQRAFYEHLRREISVAERGNEYLCLSFFDLNGFKELNDREGHLEGDNQLKNVALAMEESVRTIDLCARYGGDEFGIIMPRTELKDANRVCERVVEKFESLPSKGTSFSVGIYQIGPGAFRDMESMVREADALMYEAKSESRNVPGTHIRSGEAETTERVNEARV